MSADNPEPGDVFEGPQCIYLAVGGEEKVNYIIMYATDVTFPLLCTTIDRSDGRYLGNVLQCTKKFASRLLKNDS